MRALRAASRRRPGTALVVVLAALAVATVAATAAVALARALQQNARGGAAALRARAAAEAGLATVLARWPAGWVTRLGPGDSEVRQVPSAAGRSAVRALRLDARRYLVTAEGGSAALAGPLGAAVRRGAVFVQLDDVAYGAAAALVAAGPASLADNTEVRAADAAPAGWTECGGPDPVSGAAVAAPSLVVAPTARVVGAVLADSSAWSAAGARFGDLDRAGLAARADVVVAAGGSYAPAPRVAPDSTCVRDAASWGEPYRGSGAVGACAGDFPVVHVRGAGVTELRGPARLQGTLLVDGGLVVVGRVEVAGLVVVAGALTAPNGTLVVDGAVVGRGGVLLGPGSAVRRSRCVLDRAAAGATRPAPLARRAWSDLVR